MQAELQINAKNTDLGEASRHELKRRAAKLGQFCDRISHCRVTVEVPHRFKKESMNAVQYNVHIDLTVPGKEIAIRHRPDRDLNVAIREAFDAAERNLEEYAQKLRHETKRHETPPHGVVTSIFQKKGYGFITAEDGGQIYFHERSVLDGKFNQLKVGSTVRYHEEMGDKGPQASTVALEVR